MSLIFKILPDYVCGCFTPNTSDKVAGVPQFSSPKLLTQFGEFSKYFTSYLVKCGLQVIRNPFIQNMLPVLWYPCQMILQIIYGMLRPSYPHAAVILESNRLMQTSLPHISASHFHSASKLTGIQRVFSGDCINKEVIKMTL